jgi:uncharacterized OB-fold protein
MSGTYAPVIVGGKIEIPYKYHAGPVATRFYDALEKERRILGLRCPSCRTVYMPPRGTCGRCFCEMDDWVELRPEGEVTSYTVVHYEEPGLQPMKPPFAYALIKLDGADTAFIHLLGEVDPAAIRIGMRVTAEFAGEKPGNILAIRYFKPV